MLKHIWFDFGGTLYEETPTFNVAHDIFRFQLYADLKGLDNLEAAEQEYMRLYRQHGSNSAVFTALGKPSDYWMQALENLDFTKLIAPHPAVVPTLLALKEMLPISIFTNFKPHKIEALSEHLGILENWFTHIVSGDDVINRKPALDGFHKMIELSGVSPEHIMYVGDRVDVDIKPAKQLGMQTCLVYSKSEEADYSLQSFAELQEIVKRML